MTNPGNALPVVMAVDEAYAGYASVAIASLFANATAGNPVVHVLTTGLSQGAAEALAEVSRRFGRPIHLLAIDATPVAGLGGAGAISNATYWRLFSAQLSDFNRVLYLDADIIVEADISPLFEIEMGDALIAGVVDRTGSAAAHQRLDLPDQDPYLNGGVLLINAQRWREENVAARCIDYARRHADRTLLADQDLINAVLCHQKLILDARWNLLQLDLGIFNLRNRPEIIAGDFFIFHFNSRVKPWMEWSDPWAQQIFDRYRHLTGLKQQPRLQPGTVNEWLQWAATMDGAEDFKKANMIRKHIIAELMQIIQRHGG